MDEAGRPTRDPDAALRGALLTFGGHKGSGLSLVVELLGVLCGGHAAGGPVPKKVARNWANTVIAVDPRLLMDPAEFERRVRQTCDGVKAAGPAVLLPGEVERRNLKANLARGGLDVSAALLGKIRELAAARPASRL